MSLQPAQALEPNPIPPCASLHCQPPLGGALCLPGWSKDTMFPTQCQRGVTGGSVSAKPALTQRKTPPPLCLSWALSPLAGAPPPLSLLSKNLLWKMYSCLSALVLGER